MELKFFLNEELNEALYSGYWYWMEPLSPWKGSSWLLSRKGNGDVRRGCRSEILEPVPLQLKRWLRRQKALQSAISGFCLSVHSLHISSTLTSPKDYFLCALIHCPPIAQQVWSADGLPKTEENLQCRQYGSWGVWGPVWWSHHLRLPKEAFDNSYICPLISGISLHQPSCSRSDCIPEALKLKFPNLGRPDT